MARTRVKICGVTRPRDAERAVEFGADLVGLNFYAGSPRCIEIPSAHEIREAVAGRVRLVGVFVNEASERVREIAAETRLDLLQFHGDESPDALQPFAGRAIKVLRLAAPPRPTLLRPWTSVWGFLVEGRRSHGYGGSGKSWAYEMIEGLPREKPLLVAGGLNPTNVRAAVRRLRVWGVDVCSGVETGAGLKSTALMERFFDEVRRGDEEAEAAACR